MTQLKDMRSKWFYAKIIGEHTREMDYSHERYYQSDADPPRVWHMWGHADPKRGAQVIVRRVTFPLCYWKGTDREWTEHDYTQWEVVYGFTSKKMNTAAAKILLESVRNRQTGKVLCCPDEVAKRADEVWQRAIYEINR